MSDSAYLYIMKKAAENAAISLVRDFGELEKLQTSRKGFGRFVDAACEKSRERIISELSKARPDFSFLDNSEMTVSSSPAWIVSPIDGTVNFSRGIPYFATNIAIMDNNNIIAGITFDPMRRDCFRAEVGSGAFLGNHNRLRVSGREIMEGSLVAVHGTTDIDATLNQHNVVVRRNGSIALDLVYLAAGKYDAVIAHDVDFVDIASGLIIIRESGGFMECSIKNNTKYDVVAAASIKLLNLIKDLC
jgi:myo-inositol-1(or 4)-monophosphatase